MSKTYKDEPSTKHVRRAQRNKEKNTQPYSRTRKSDWMSKAYENMEEYKYNNY